MIKKSVWLCAILAALTAAPTARAQEIKSWADLLPLIEGRGEAVVRRMELVRGGGFDLGRDVNDNYYIRAQLEVVGESGISENGFGQLLEVLLTRKILQEDSIYVEKNFLNYALQNRPDGDGRIQFSPILYPEDTSPNDILKFYVYIPGAVLPNPERTLQISYTIEAEKNRDGSFDVIYPGCFKVKSGSDEIDHGREALDPVMQTCPPFSTRTGADLVNWDIREGLTGSGWLRAALSDGRNEFEGLILVLQPESSTLDLSIPAPCNAPESGCGEVAETFSTVVPELMEDANTSKYYALAVGPVDPNSWATIEAISGTLLENSSGPSFEIKTENAFPLEQERGIYTLSISQPMAEGYEGGNTISMNLSGEYEGQYCDTVAFFSEGLSSLAAPAIFRCSSDEEISTTALPQISAMDQTDETIAVESAEGTTLQLRTALTNLNPSLTNSNLEARDSSISNGACAGYDGPAEREGELQLFCLSGELGDEKFTFNYQIGGNSIAYMGPTRDIRDGGLNSIEVVQTNWTVLSSLPLSFTIQFVGDDVSAAFWERLAITQTLLVGSAGNPQSQEIDFTIDEEARTVRLTLPEQVVDTMLADLDEPAFQIDVTGAIGQLAEVSGDGSSPSAYFPPAVDGIPLRFILQLSDLLPDEELVVPVNVSANNYRFGGRTINVWVDIPRVRKTPMPCPVGIRIAEENYWLEPNDDRTSYVFPSSFPQISDGDLLTIIAGPVEGASGEQETVTEKLCPKLVEAISEVPVSELEDLDRPLLVPLTRPVLAYFSRSYTSDDEYGTRNRSAVYRVGFAPVLDLQQERLVAFYTPTGSGGARSFELFNQISGTDPFTARDVEGRISGQLAAIMRANTPEGSPSIAKILRGALLDREDFGLSGPYWPDIVIMSYGDRPFTCRTVESALTDLKLIEDLDGIGAPNATLSIYYDSFNALASGRNTESVSCETDSKFGRVNLFNTSLSEVFNTGRGRFDLADEIQSEWEDIVWALAGEVED